MTEKPESVSGKHLPDCPHLDPQAPCICAPPPTADAPPEWCYVFVGGLAPTRREAVARLIHAAYLASEEARKVERLVAALEAASEHLSACCPSNSYGLMDHDADRERAEVLAQVRAALAAGERT